MTFHLLGYACGIAAGDTGCADGPVALWHENIAAQLAPFNIAAETFPLFYPEMGTDKYVQIAEICQRLSQSTENLSRQKQLFAVMGGDHACAIGTWGGVSRALRSQGDIGLIWIDAHLDSHTPDTSHSGNIHGMPLAVLLGYGDARLTSLVSPVLKPQNVCVVAARSYETEEKAFLEKLNVRIFYQQEIRRRGLSAVLRDAKQQVTQSTVGFGVSLDLDSIDPLEAPGVGTPEINGLHVHALYPALRRHIAPDPRWLGTEITEFNPHHDFQGKTRRVVLQSLIALFGEKPHVRSHA